VQEVLGDEIDPVEASQRLLKACSGHLHLPRRLDDPAFEHRVLGRGELIVKALKRLAPG
jgi:hypothetical protein